MIPLDRKVKNLSKSIKSEPSANLRKQISALKQANDALAKELKALKASTRKVSQKKQTAARDSFFNDDQTINRKELAAFAESSRSAILIIQADKILFVNSAVEDITGYSSQEIYEMKFYELVHPDMREMVKDRSFSRQRGEAPPAHYEMKLLRKDGVTRWVDFSATDFQLNGKGAVFATAFDISENIITKEALKQSEEKYHNILENIQDGYFEVDLAGNLIFFNDALCHIAGETRETLKGINNRDYTSAKTARHMYRIFNAVYRTGEPARITSHEIVTRDGTKKYLEISATLMKDDAGQPKGFRGIVRDMTDRICREKEKKRLEEQLQKALRMEAIGTLAGGIAHDFNNLLTSIQGNVSIMKLRTDPSHPNVEKIKRLEHLVESGADLTRQLLGFAMGGKYEVQPTQINALMRRSVNIIDRTKKEIRISEDYQPDLWLTEVDRVQIEQVLINLYVNAAHAMPRGGELHLKTQNVVLTTEKAKRLELAADKKYIRISVSDTGQGMDAHTMERIFEPFFTTKEMGRGTGLGLASAYGIIKNHRGKITVNSRKSIGSRFDIYLPASESVPRPPATVPPGEVSDRSPTILFVDDEPDVRSVGREMLSEIGYQVFTADNEKEALTLLEGGTKEFDLIIIDMNMMDVSDAALRSTLKKISPHTRILISSGFNAEVQTNDLLDTIHPDGFIQKPFKMKMLAEKIQEVLDIAQAGD